MKTLCGFIGWILGLILAFIIVDSVPILSLILIFGGGPLGSYIGKSIEESRREEELRQQNERIKREAEEQKRWEEFRIKSTRAAQVRSLCSNYPEATKAFVKAHGCSNPMYSLGIDDKTIACLLSHPESEYQRLEEELNFSYRSRVQEKRRVEMEAKHREERERKIAIQSLPSCVSSWKHLASSLPYCYLMPYYPTTCDFEATASEWNDRHLIWNFKNTPGKTLKIEHDRALNVIIPRLKKQLMNTFGDRTKYLTLVCIPASSRSANESRFKEFSERLTRETGMENSYDRIQITQDATPKHLGGTGTPEVRFDRSFFNGKNVILFDDVITRGDSMLRYRNLLVSLGARVIAGMSIGKTSHSRL